MYKIYLVVLLAGVVGSACGTSTEAMTPDRLQQQYGITGSYTGSLQTPDGSIRGTIVPVTLADGRGAQLILPVQGRNEAHTVYVRDADGFHPVQLQDNVTREQMVQSSAPVVVGRRAEPAHPNKSGWEKDALIIGGGAGGGALVGALAGGKKGAGIGAAAGGIGGLIYDLAK
jgi:hypothetical protein